MRLKRIKLNSSYRSLPEGFELHFPPKSEPNSDDQNDIENQDEELESQFIYCFVGPNGSGKSNVMEALADIFFQLDLYALKYEESFDTSLVPNSYEIDYLIPSSTARRQIVLTQRGEQEGFNGDVLVKIKKVENSTPTVAYGTSIENMGPELSSPQDFLTVLPSKVWAYSSGDNEILSLPFKKLDFLYFQNLDRRRERTFHEYIGDGRLTYFDYGFTNAILISNYLFPDQDRLDKFKERTGIEELKSFVLDFKFKAGNYKEIAIPANLDSQVAALKEIGEVIEEVEGKSLRIRIDLGETETEIDQIKEKFRANFLDPYGLYKVLSKFNFLNFYRISRWKREKVAQSNEEYYVHHRVPTIEEDRKLFSIQEVVIKHRNSDLPINYKGVSDGEHQLIHCLGLAMMLDDDASLLLLDEPATHLNPKWKYDYMNLMEEVLENRKVQVLLNTHDPILLSGMKKENIVVFGRDSDTKKVFSKPADEDLLGKGVDGILVSDIFGMDTTIDPDTKKKMVERRELLLKKYNQRGELSPDDSTKLTELSEELVQIDFNQPLNDPLYRDYLNAFESLEMYKQPILSIEEKERRETQAREILDKLRQERGL